MAEHDRDADVDGAPPIGGKPSTDALMAENFDEADVDGAPPSGGKPSTDAHWHLHCSRSQETCPFGGTPPATSMPVLGNVRRTIGASCYQYPKECSLVFTPSWLSAGIGMPLSSG